MQIPKFFLWTYVLVLCGGLALHAQDNPAQAAARQALEQKMKELDANPPASGGAGDNTGGAGNSYPSAGDTAAPAAAASAPIAPTVDSEVVMKPVNKKAKPADSVRASQKSDSKAAELKAKKEADKKLAAERAVQAKADAKRAAAKAQAEKAATKAAEVATKPVKIPASIIVPGKNAEVNPTSATALPIPATKQEKLQSLLQKYKADQISPEEYHHQRASILAEP